MVDIVSYATALPGVNFRGFFVLNASFGQNNIVDTADNHKSEFAVDNYARIMHSLPSHTNFSLAKLTLDNGADIDTLPFLFPNKMLVTGVLFKPILHGVIKLYADLW